MDTLQETTDAELFGRATLWALGEDKARNQIFNVSNGECLSLASTVE